MNWTTIDILILIGGWVIGLICLCLYLGQNKNLDKMFEMAHEAFDRLDSYDRIASKAIALSTDILNDLKQSNDHSCHLLDQLAEKEDLITDIRGANCRLSDEVEELMEENRKLSEQVRKLMSMEDDGK